MARSIFAFTRLKCGRAARSRVRRLSAQPCRPAAALACLLVLLFLLPPAPFSPVSRARAQAARNDEERLLEVGSHRARTKPAIGGEVLKVVSYNIRWRGGEDLRELIRLLREDTEIGGADIIGLQEVDRAKRRTNHTNTAKLIAEELGLNYAWAAPPPEKADKEEETGVALFSPHPLADVQRLILPHEGPNKRRRAAVGATVMVGTTPVRAYSVHAETRMPLDKKVEHWRAVLDDMSHHPQVGHVVVVGDFNTIKGKDVRAARKLFAEAGFTTPFPDNRSTWRTFIFDLKLDWLWLRGFEHVDHGIDKEVGLSDHWPLWATVRLRQREGGAPADGNRAGTN
jgi:endonuclease/exonuclease/phosphatase family metal-dependent hydrolase